ncbi:MOSC domain-containing protein [Paenibacillus sp. SYP-B3998]|uniref:MOSC domain-containing protein n=1 Tax=Paenibacillus sp. SYP-B3998 TaxID=2678564 RepID=A0A6G4A1W5_9BACL|nr:MOSC N-terminal beta barrel domain-containing protein [Paenibacillus sp. SYP-B3998]NEW07637.1 MOSC domain-containing protein [Paenibacillus sp. SYP-B3998]
MTLIGEISEINRYPIKSFAGERLETCIVETYGLYGDRCYAFIDETKEGWESFFTARTIPNMLAYKAKLIGEGFQHELPKVSVTSPDNRIFNWNEELLNEMQRFSKKKMSMKSYQSQNADLMAVDSSSLLIITDSTLRNLEKIWGKSLDKRRFRANLVVTVDEGAGNECEWIGKRVAVGSAELQIDTYCERCSMITIDPDDLERDSSLLRKVNEEMNLSFGVYASVKKTGHIHTGEKVYLLD